MTAHNRTPEKQITLVCQELGLDFQGCEYGSRTYVYFCCSKHWYKGIQKINREALMRWYKSKECKCVLVHRDEEDLRRDPNLSNEVEIIGKYIKLTIKIECKCKQCGHNWFVTPNKLQQGEGCPNCAIVRTKKKLTLTNQEFASKISNSRDDIQIIGHYTGMKRPIQFKCKKCGKIQTAKKAEDLIRNYRGCSFCNPSKGERKIYKFLSDNRIEFETQKSFKGCKDIRSLRFDFYLPEKNICIEYQGEQHYFPVAFNGETHEEAEQNYIALKRRDQIKVDYCQRNNMGLIAIPFWDYEVIPLKLKNALDFS